MNCRNCNAPLLPGSMFCTECGCRVEATSAGAGASPFRRAGSLDGFDSGMGAPVAMDAPKAASEVRFSSNLKRSATEDASRPKVAVIAKPAPKAEAAPVVPAPAATPAPKAEPAPVAPVAAPEVKVAPIVKTAPAEPDEEKTIMLEPAPVPKAAPAPAPKAEAAPVAPAPAATTAPKAEPAKCGKCGSVLEEDAMFCGVCGNRVAAPEAAPAATPAPAPAPAPKAEPAKCSNCGSPLDEGAVFCSVCGNRTAPAAAATAAPAAAPAAAAPAAMPYGVAYSAAPVKKLKTNKKLWKYLLFGFLTFGIYNLVVLSSVSNSVNTVATRYDGKRTMHYCLLYFLVGYWTLGIGYFVWYHKMSNRIGDELERRGIDYSFGAGKFWLWNVLLGFVFVGPCIYYHKLFKACNKMCEHYNRFG